LFDRAHGAAGYLGWIIFALEIVGDLDRLRQGAGYVRPHDFA
jgi:hypothetical protein